MKREFGVIGEQLYAMSWGVDRSIIRNKYIPIAKSYSNSQVYTVGVGYAHGYLPWLQPEPHDVPLDAVLTEDGLAWQRPD